MNDLLYAFLQMSSVGNAVVFAQIHSDELENYESRKIITLIKPLLLFQQSNPKGEIVTTISPFPTSHLPVFDKSLIQINTTNIIWIKQITEITATENELILINNCKKAQIGAYSSIKETKN